MSYTDADEYIEKRNERLYGPRCPQHRSRACGCCSRCGCSQDKAHLPWCDFDDTGSKPRIA